MVENTAVSIKLVYYSKWSINYA